jgi:hypothetical protein
MTIRCGPSETTKDGELLAEGAQGGFDGDHRLGMGRAEAGHTVLAREVERVRQRRGVALEQVVAGEVAEPVDVHSGELGVEDELVGVVPVVVVARRHEDRDAELLDGREVRPRGGAEDQLAEEEGVARADEVVPHLELVVDEVARGHDDVELPRIVQRVREADEAAEPVVPAHHLVGGLVSPERAQGRAEGVDPTGDVGVGDVRDPEVGPPGPEVERVRSDDPPSPSSPVDRDVVEPTYLN